MTAGPAAAARHYLNPCALIAAKEELEVTTILGSCVSVCLWDPQLAVGGINHYMLPTWNGDGLPTPKFGNVAIEKLMAWMLGLGCKKERLVAKCFGGAHVVRGTSALPQVGERNIQLACELLSMHRIPMVAHDLGGDRGMKIIFNTRTGVAQVGRLIHPVPQPGASKAGSSTPELR